MSCWFAATCRANQRVAASWVPVPIKEESRVSTNSQTPSPSFVMRSTHAIEEEVHASESLDSSPSSAVSSKLNALEVCLTTCTVCVWTSIWSTHAQCTTWFFTLSSSRCLLSVQCSMNKRSQHSAVFDCRASLFAQKTMFASLVRRLLLFRDCLL